MNFNLQKALNNGGRCRTANGNEARIICVDADYFFDGKKCPIIALVRNMQGHETLQSHSEDGKYWPGNNNHINLRDLQNIPDKFRFERWVNVYDDGVIGENCIDPEIADRYAKAVKCSRERIVRIKITIEGEEGQYD